MESTIRTEIELQEKIDSYKIALEYSDDLTWVDRCNLKIALAGCMDYLEAIKKQRNETH